MGTVRKEHVHSGVQRTVNLNDATILKLGELGGQLEFARPVTASAGGTDELPGGVEPANGHASPVYKVNDPHSAVSSDKYVANTGEFVKRADVLANCEVRNQRRAARVPRDVGESNYRVARRLRSKGNVPRDRGRDRSDANRYKGNKGNNAAVSKELRQMTPPLSAFPALVTSIFSSALIWVVSQAPLQQQPNQEAVGHFHPRASNR
jgi:hypothetical protein